MAKDSWQFRCNEERMAHCVFWEQFTRLCAKNHSGEIKLSNSWLCNFRLKHLHPVNLSVFYVNETISIGYNLLLPRVIFFCYILTSLQPKSCKSIQCEGCSFLLHQFYFLKCLALPWKSKINTLDLPWLYQCSTSYVNIYQLLFWRWWFENLSFKRQHNFNCINANEMLSGITFILWD